MAILRRACEYRAVRVENKHLKQEIKRRDKAGVSRPIGKSRRFLDMLKLAEQVAPTDSTVLIQGESGTGKEVIAQYIHNHVQPHRRARSSRSTAARCRRTCSRASCSGT